MLNIKLMRLVYNKLGSDPGEILDLSTRSTSVSVT